MSGRIARVDIDTSTLKPGKGFVHQSPVPGESLMLECLDVVDDGGTTTYVCRVTLRVRSNPHAIALPSGPNVTNITTDNN